MDANNMYDDYDNDVTLEPEDRQRVRADRPEWFKMVKNQTQVSALLYFHPLDVTTQKAFASEARKAGLELSRDNMKKAGHKALEERASALGKPLEQLTAVEKLDLSRVQFRTCRASYHVDIGFTLTRLGLDGPEADSVWKLLPEPTQYFSTLLLLYPTTPEGKLDVEGTRAGKWRLVPWRFGRSMYHEIFSLNDGLRANGLSIAEQDVRLECQDAKYQRIKVSFVGKAVWRSNDSFKQKVLSVAVPQYDRLVPFRAMSTDDLRSKLGLGGTPGLGATPMNPVSDTDFSGLLDTV
jgi:hypothetical protein